MSAVFGHLRLVPPTLFWEDFFARARAATAVQFSLLSELVRSGVAFERYSDLEIIFGKPSTYTVNLT